MPQTAKPMAIKLNSSYAGERASACELKKIEVKIKENEKLIKEQEEIKVTLSDHSDIQFEIF